MLLSYGTAVSVKWTTESLIVWNTTTAALAVPSGMDYTPNGLRSSLSTF
jgi:hypothetical protein